MSVVEVIWLWSRISSGNGPWQVLVNMVRCKEFDKLCNNQLLKKDSAPQN
jgi:hypothetical protein